MKRCPECKRDYYDRSLIYCLDDGAQLLEGPASGADQPTAILNATAPPSEAATKILDRHSAPSASQRNSIIAGAVGMLLITALGIGGYLYYGRDSSRQIESIAVMPFVNDSGNPDIDYLSDGITESLINSLSQIPALSVKASSSVFSYKGKEVSPQQVARDLAVQALLSGRLAQRGDQVFVNVELVDAMTGNRVWGDRYVRSPADLIQLESEIARDVAGKLRTKLTGADQQKIARNHTENTEAYRLYLKGRHHWNKRKPDDIKKSVEYFRQAIDADPTYALAHAALGEAYILFSNYGVSSGKEAYPKARAAAAKAIEIDPSLAEAHTVMATVLHAHDWKFAEAEAEWQRALDLNPNYATARQWYAEHLMEMGRFREALVEMRRAQELDPLSLIINGLVGMNLHLNGQHEAALEQLKKTVEMDPNFPRTHFFLSTVYQGIGRYEEAVDEFAKGVVLNGAPPERTAELAAKIKAAARAGGERAYSRAMAEAMETNASTAVPPAPFLAAYWIKAGETDKAFQVLENAYQKRDDSILMIKGPGLDPVKSDPRYADLVRRIGLPSD